LERSDDPGEFIRGGQTGSLTPACGVATDVGSVSVPGGDGALVLYTADCPELAAAGMLTLTDAAGNRIDVDLVSLGDGKFLVQTSTMLTPGSYGLSSDQAGSVEVNVSDTAPLPTELGSLVQISASDCSVRFAFELSAQALPYAELIQLTASIDGAEPIVWVDFGLLDAVLEPVSLTLPCAESCLAPGVHQLTVAAHIAGEVSAPTPLVASFDSTCRSAASEDPGSCALARPSGNSSPSWPILTLFTAWCWRRARRHRGGQRDAPGCLNPQPTEPLSFAPRLRNR
jgi:hypothetical protein